MLTCYDVAEYFLTLIDEEVGDLMSNLKLQKLVYYAQGLHLALYDKPLFKENLEAWQYGPVVPELYHFYKDFGSGAIPVPQTVNFDKYNNEIKAFLNEVYAVYGQFSAFKLSQMTHEEPPWKETSLNQVISHESMKTFFQTRIVQDD